MIFNTDIKFDVNVETKLSGSQLTLITSVGDYVTRKVLELEEEAIKSALVKLGWTPPPPTPSPIPPPMEPTVDMLRSSREEEFSSRWICLHCLSSIKGVHTKVCPNYEG